MSTAPAWDVVRDRWPNASASRFVEAGGLRWHVQVLGAGPVVLLLHGSGAATHTWRELAPLLAAHCTVIAPDLPGHGFTARPSAERLSLDGMATSIDALLHTLHVVPGAIVGHSAGGALALWLARTWPSTTIVGLNAALAPPHPLLSFVAPGMRLLTSAFGVGALTALLARNDRVFEALMQSTGSTIDAEQTAWYRAFAQTETHAAALMSMFAHWDLNALAPVLPAMNHPVTLVVGADDGWVSPAETKRIAARLPNARVITVDQAGHLVHEEFPERVSGIILDAMR